MTQDRYENLIRQLEKQVQKTPHWYKIKVSLLISIGFAYILLITAILLACSALLLLGITKFHFLAVKLAIPLIAVIWVLLKSLRVKIDAPEGMVLSKEMAPALFQDIAEMSKALKGLNIHKILLTEEMNAAVTQIPRLGILGWHKNYLLLGLPLMQALSAKQFRAVLAHELGHLARSHSRFHGWVYRIRRSWSKIIEQIQEKKHRWSFLFDRFLRWYAPLLNVHTFVLARKNEYEADQYSAQLAGARTAADALILLHLQDKSLQEQFWPGIHKLADRQAEPPSLYYEIGSFFHQSVPEQKAKVWMADTLAIETDYWDTHPSLKDRLSALGQEIRIPEDVTTHAADFYLDPSLSTILKQFSEKWQNDVQASWQKRYEYVRYIERRIHILNEKPETDLSVDDLWELGELTEQLHGSKEALPFYQRVLIGNKDYAPAYFAAGRILISEQKDGEPYSNDQKAEGAAYLDRTMELDHESTYACCNLLAEYFRALHQEDKAAEYVERMQKYTELHEQAQEERNKITKKDTFIEHELSDRELTAISKQLENFKAITDAYLVQKKVNIFPEKPLLVLFIKAKDGAMAQKVADEVEFPYETIIYNLKTSRRFTNLIRRFPQSRFYRHRRNAAWWNPIRLTVNVLDGLLHRFTESGDPSLVNFLLHLGANPNSLREDHSPLSIAAYHGHISVMNVLLSHKADPNLQNSEGNTPLFWAAYDNELDAVKLLLEAGADPNIRFVSGRTLVSAVCMNGYAEILSILLEAGAEPVYPCYEDGETPLMIATYNNRLKCVNLLLTSNTDPNVRSRNGYTALRFAKEYGFDEIAAALESKGAVLH